MMTTRVCVSYPEEIVALDDWCKADKHLHFVSLLEKGFFASNCSISGSYMESP